MPAITNRPLDLVLIRGLPGSGKSTLAEALQEKAASRTDIFEADDFFDVGNPVTGDWEYKFNPKLLGAAHDGCYSRAMQMLYNGVNVIVANTFSTHRELNRYIDGVARSGLNVRVHVVLCSGDFGSTHNVPQRAIQRMKDRWEPWPGEITMNLLEQEIAA